MRPYLDGLQGDCLRTVLVHDGPTRQVEAHAKGVKHKSTEKHRGAAGNDPAQPSQATGHRSLLSALEAVIAIPFHVGQNVDASAAAGCNVAPAADGCMR